MTTTHEQIFYDGGDNIGYTTTGVFINDSKDGYECKEQKYDGDIMRRAVDRVKNKKTLGLFSERKDMWSGDSYNFIIHNCQDFVTEVLQEYKALKGLKGLSGLGEYY